MIVRRNHLTLLLLNIATVTAGPAAVAHRTLNASLLNTHTGPSDGGSENTRPDAQAFYQSHGPPFSVAQEAIHGAMPPPLWHVLFEEHLDLRLRSNDDYKIRAESQQQRNWLQTLVPFYLPNTKNVSNNCRRDVKAISSGIVNQTQWALRMVDSWGKFTDGVLAGNAMVMGLLDECLMLSVDQYSPQPRAEFKGQYCAFSVSMKPKSTSARWTDLEEGDEEEEGEEEEEDEERVKVLVPGLRMGNVKGLLQVAIPFNLLSTCIPSTCTKEEYGVRLGEERVGNG
ncbi:O-acyltransferase like protein [Chionoecetes opilio]|uniref:O-acyltransferase like protein n=1 Tax=Chionoecetes opilio TaxID=41210 RepID=A0A8J4Y2U7_CHIOP|nr:O-acyltransferase like protein [Chionoecetes opilio]